MDGLTDVGPNAGDAFGWGGTKNDVSRAGVLPAIIVSERTDDHVGESVAVHVARCRDAPPQPVVLASTLNDKPLVRRKIRYGDRSQPLRAAEDNVGVTVVSV